MQKGAVSAPPESTIPAMLLLCSLLPSTMLLFDVHTHSPHSTEPNESLPKSQLPLLEQLDQIPDPPPRPSAAPVEMTMFLAA